MVFAEKGLYGEPNEDLQNQAALIIGQHYNAHTLALLTAMEAHTDALAEGPVARTQKHED